jgi:hypothetical protein
MNIKSDTHNNRIAVEGVTRCDCGSKYWESDRCVDCGADASTSPDSSNDPFVPQEVAWMLPGAGWRSRTVNSEAALNRLLDMIWANDDAIVQWRDAL